ncbi:MAG: hypothetical protein FK732_11995 [Asgard group archaeon]|nr:hypothetical protein [Asgard group archaeon]
MTKNVINLNICELSVEERKRIENEFKSNLRYSWQKSIAFALSYKPTIEEVMEELLKTFQKFIPENHPLKGFIGCVITASFREILGKLFTTDDITDIEIENDFISIVTNKLREVLF